MTESEWLTCRDPGAMLAHLGAGADARKRRLFECACHREFRNLSDKGSEALFDWFERWIDGSASAEDLGAAAAAAAGGPMPGEELARTLEGQVRFHFRLMLSGSRSGGPASARQAALLRDIFGNPFRPPARPDPAWLAFNDRLIPRLAEGIHEERAFDRTPILGDALEEAGCADRAVLDHCHGPGPHARGCWVIDWLREGPRAADP